MLAYCVYFEGQLDRMNLLFSMGYFGTVKLLNRREELHNPGEFASARVIKYRGLRVLRYIGDFVPK